MRSWTFRRACVLAHLCMKDVHDEARQTNIDTFNGFRLGRHREKHTGAQTVVESSVFKLLFNSEKAVRSTERSTGRSTGRR